MPYDPIPAQPGIAGTTLQGGNVKVYFLTLQTMGKIRIQADVTQGTAAIGLELHLFTYPATSFTSKQTYIEAVLPVGTHYVAVRSVPGGVHYLLWRKRVTQCPTGCVPATHMARTIREMAANFHKQAGLPPPTDEEVRAITPDHAVHLLAPPPRHVSLGPQHAPRPAQGKPAPPKPKPQPVRVLMPDGPAVRVVLTASQNEAKFTSDVVEPGNYEFKVSPPPVQQQELFFLNVLSDRGQVVQSSSDGRLLSTLSARTWKSSLVVPKNLLRAPRTFNVALKKKAIQPGRPGLDNPPDGDGHLLTNTAVAVDIKHTRPKAQCYVEIPESAKWKFTCVEITGGSEVSPQANSPATMTLYDAGGVLTLGPTQPGAAFTSSLSPGRWWVDFNVPDFHGRTTPRRYAVGVAKIGPA